MMNKEYKNKILLKIFFILFNVTFIIIFILNAPLNIKAQETVSLPKEYYESSIKAFTEVKISREQIKLLEEQVDLLKEFIQKQEQVIKTMEDTIKFQDNKINELIKLKCDKTSYLFGIVKKTKCR